MKTETGVMVIKNGKGWGTKYSDGQCTEYGWVDYADAIISDPRYISAPEDLTYDGSYLVEELKTGKMFMVERVTTVSILDAAPGKGSKPVQRKGV